MAHLREIGLRLFRGQLGYGNRLPGHQHAQEDAPHLEAHLVLHGAHVCLRLIAIDPRGPQRVPHLSPGVEALLEGKAGREQVGRPERQVHRLLRRAAFLVLSLHREHRALPDPVSRVAHIQSNGRECPGPGLRDPGIGLLPFTMRAHQVRIPRAREPRAGRHGQRGHGPRLFIAPRARRGVKKPGRQHHGERRRHRTRRPSTQAQHRIRPSVAACGQAQLPGFRPAPEWGSASVE